MTIVRIWRTDIDPERASEYERFAATRSLPIFREQPGCEGVLFVRRRSHAAVISLWRDKAAIEALEASLGYRQTVAAISAAGFLVGQPTLEVFELHGGFLVDTVAESLVLA